MTSNRGETAWRGWLALVIAAALVSMLGVLPFFRGGNRAETSTAAVADGVGASSTGDDRGDGQAAPEAAVATTPPGQSAGPATASETQPQAGVPTLTTQPGATTEASAVGIGITDDTITVGIGWFDINAYTAILAPSADRQTYTTRDAADAVVRWLNERGGIAGRQIQPVYHEYPVEDALGSNSSRNTREQAMCADFTEDHRAFAAIPWISSQGVFYECAAQHNLVTVATSFSEGLVDRELYERIAHVFYVPHGLLIDRREAMFVEQLDRRGFFTPDAKIGVILQDYPSTRRAADAALYPALEARGVDVVETAFYSELSTNYTNIVLRFRSAGVTHVVWGSSAATFIPSSGFMVASENQGYRPYNALGSDHGLALQYLVTPAAQRERIVAISWSPIDQGGDAYHVAEPINDADAQCREVREGSGVDLAQQVFVPYCDGLFFLKQALEAAPEPTAEGLRSAVESESVGYPVVDAWSAAWTAGRHDAAGAVRDATYNADCECFRFSGPLHPIG